MTTEPKNELLPCPFCGDTPVVREQYDFIDGEKESHGFFIDHQCTVTIASGKMYGGGDKAADAWNTRPAKAVQGDNRDLARRLNIKADMIQMGEKIAWGSDSEIMREAALALLSSTKETAVPEIDALGNAIQSIEDFGETRTPEEWKALAKAARAYLEMMKK